MKNKCPHFKHGSCEKSFKDMTFDELVAHIRGSLVVAIGKGTFKEQVYFCCDLVLRWRKAQGEK